jgi:alginate O-acetyltransferase complex protein AlgJ
MPQSNPEEISQAQLRNTQIGPGTARAMTWAFVVLLASISVGQAAAELRRHQIPQVFDLVKPVGTFIGEVATGRWHDARAQFAAITRREFPKNFETALERVSVAKWTVQPHVQALLTGALGFGNDKVNVGRNGWLFYQPGLDYIAGPDITDPAYLAGRVKTMIDRNGERDPHPDSRETWRQLQEDTASAGIRLVLAIVPDKSMLQPEQITSRVAIGTGRIPANNSGYARFAADLRAMGIDLFDPIPDLVRPGERRYLVQDSHWTPEFMDEYSAALARHLEPSGPPADAPFRLEPRAVSRVGDLVDTLRLPAGQRLYPAQTVTTQAVIDTRTGRPVEEDKHADVLLLGDSFTNIYSQPSLGWGEGAGLAEHLAYHLGHRVDAVAFNGAGAGAIRAELARRAAASDSPWTTRVLVYQLAARFLMGENWARIPVRFPAPAAVSAPPIVVPAPATSAAAPPVAIPAPKVARPDARTASPPAAPVVVLAEVRQTSKVPAPGTAPYKDCLVYAKLHIDTVESGSLASQDIIGAFWAMRDDKWLPAATYVAGDRLRVTLVPLEQTDRQTQALQRADDLNDFTTRVFFVTAEEQR